MPVVYLFSLKAGTCISTILGVVSTLGATIEKEDTMRTLIAVLAVFFFVSAPALAQETQHPAAGQTDPYLGLKDAEGTSCCHNQHCRPALYQQRGSEHWMSTDHGKTWFQVPAEKEVLPTPEVRALGGATWCGTLNGDGTRYHRCWVRPKQDPSV